MSTTIVPLAQHLRTRERAAVLRLVGADLGNSTALLADEERVIQIPSHIGLGNLQDLLTARGGAGAAQALGPGEYAIEYGEQTYYVGELALGQARDAGTGRGDTARYTNGHTLRLLMALAGAMYDGDVRLRVVTGVPPSVLREQPQLKAQIGEALIGTHHYTFYDHRGAREMVLVVEAVGVVMEGVATLASLGETGKPVGIVDVGGHTTDIAWFGADGKIVETRTDSLADAGVERIGALLSQRFRQQHGRPLTPAEVDRALRAYLEGTEATIYHRGAQRITVEEVEQAIQVVAASINTFLARRWSLGQDGTVGADGAYVLIVGGGAYYLPRHLRVDTEVRVVQAAEQANALSYARLAQRIEARASWPQLQQRGR